jgi:hypothetical protein
MFERFTPEARAAVVQAQQHAIRLGHNFIGGEHLLLAVVSAGQPASAILGAHGITAEYVETEIVRRIGLGRDAGSGDVPFAGLDRHALASIGIDLDAVEARIEATFGPRAMAEADLMVQRRRRPSRGAPGLRRFRLDPRRALPPGLRRSGRRFGTGRLITATPPRPPRSAELAAARCRGGDSPRDGHIPFTPVAKHILELTLRETRALPDPQIGVQHLALALTAVRRGMVPALLAAADAPAPALHAEIVNRYRQAS